MATTGSRILLGVGIGCGVLALVAVGSCVAFLSWLDRPGVPAQPQQLIGSDTTGYAAWTLSLEDPGIRTLLDRLFERLDAGNSPDGGALPEGVEIWLPGIASQTNRKQVDDLFPLTVGWSLAAGDAPDDDLQVGTLAIERLGNRIVLTDWFLGFTLARSPEFESETYAGERIYRLREPDVAFFLRSGQVFVTSGLAAAREAVDRLAAASRVSDAAAVDPLLRGLPDDATLRGALTKSRGEFGRVLLPLLDPAGAASAVDWEAARTATVHGRFEEDGTLAVEIEIEGTDDAWAASTAAALAGPLAAGGAATVETSLAGPRARLSLRISDLPGWIRTALE